MINPDCDNSADKSLLNKNAIIGKLNLQQKLIQISENHTVTNYEDNFAPVLKYQKKGLASPSSTFEIYSPLQSTRFVPGVISNQKYEQTSIFELPTLEEGDQCSSREENKPNELQNDSIDNFTLVPPDSYHSLASYGKSSQFNGKAHNKNSLVVPFIPSPRVGLTGSLVTPARLKHRSDIIKRSMMSNNRVKTQKLIKTNASLSMSHSKVSAEKPPSFTTSKPYGIGTTTVQRWPNSVLNKHERLRPNSAKNNLVTDSSSSKATNTVDSFLSNSDAKLTPLRPSASCSYLSNSSKESFRPKSSHSRRFINTHLRTSRSCINVNPIKNSSGLTEISVNGRKNSFPFSEDFALTSKNPPMMNSARKASAAKKSKEILTQSSNSALKNVEESARLNQETGKTYGSILHTSTHVPIAEQFENIPSERLNPKHGSLDDLCNMLKFCNTNPGSNDLSPSVTSSRYETKERMESNLRTQKLYKHATAKKAKSLKSAKSTKKLAVQPAKSLLDDNAAENTPNKREKELHFSAQTNSKGSETVEKCNKEDFTMTTQNGIISHRKYSDDSGNGTLSAKSGRCCGDGADEPDKPSKYYAPDSKEWKPSRPPGDGGDDDALFVYDENFDYEDSLLEVNESAEGEEEGNEEDFPDEMSCSQASDAGAVGEYLPCDDDDALDCIDDSAVASLDEDDAISESAESDGSGLALYFSSQQQDETFENRKPAIIKSIFSNCPPVINFSVHSEQIEPLPASTRKLLKWKMSTITPIVVRNTVMRSGFKASKKNHDWLGYFGKHMKSHGFRSLRDYQKMNHFPGSFQLGRKDRLWRNISRMQTRFGKKEFGFVPQSYVLPWDKKLLKNAWEEGSSKQKYILKPPASARGIGIRVIHKWNQIPTKKPIMVQKYLARPYLINGNKFDLRLYVHVTSFDPLRIYLFEDGLVRFATCKYSSSMKHLSNRYMHLTNYSINKKSGDFEQNNDASVCQGHKWSLTALWGYLQQKDINTDKIWEQMKDIVIKTIISVEQFTNSLVKSNCRRRYCCHELFGFDIMLDDKLRPWLLEVNISPSLHSNSPLDVEIKGPMVKDMFNLCGFLLPDKKQIAANAPSSNGGCSIPSAAASFSQEKRKQGQEVSADSKAKHTYFAQHYKLLDPQSIIAFLLDVLTVNDIRMLVESEAEAARCGGFQRIFPTTNRKYLQFFEQPRYYNEFLHAWEVKFHAQKPRAIALLESYCRKGLHLPHFSIDPSNIPSDHIWSVAALNQPKIMPSPRTDIRMLPVTIKPTSAGLSSHSHLTTSPCRTKSAKSRKNGMYGDSPSNMTVLVKQIIPAPPLQTDS